jgi:hypothetical protein
MNLSSPAFPKWLVNAEERTPEGPNFVAYFVSFGWENIATSRVRTLSSLVDLRGVISITSAQPFEAMSLRGTEPGNQP